MNKKNIIILFIAILIFLIALAIFIYAKSLDSNKTQIENKPITNTTISPISQETPYFYDIVGKKLTLDNFNEKPKIIYFWKSDNEKSYTIIRLLEKYYEEYKDKIEFLAINVNEPDIELDLINIVKSANFSIPIYFDTDLTLYEEFHYEKLPSLLFVNKNGDIEKEVLEEIEEDAFVANLDLLISNF